VDTDARPDTPSSVEPGGTRPATGDLTIPNIGRRTRNSHRSRSHARLSLIRKIRVRLSSGKAVGPLLIHQGKERISEMARVVIAASPWHGHVPTLLAVAADLVQRGNQVTFLSGTLFQQRIEATGATFAPLTGEADQDGDALLATPERLALRDLSRFAWDMSNIFIAPIRAQHEDLQRLLAQAGDEPVIVVSEPTFMGVTPLQLGAPGLRPKAFVGIGVVSYSLSSVDTAPFGMGLPPDSSAEGRARNREAYAFFQDQALGEPQKMFNAVLEEMGATEPAPFFLDSTLLCPDRFLQLSLAELSYHRTDTPGHVSFVGSVPPIPPAGVGLPDWWPELDQAEKVILVTQGTVANLDFGELIEPTLAGLADFPGLVVAATGRAGAVRNAPANARITEFVPFADMLPRTDLLITNGGYGGIQQALRHGVPLIVAGRSEDRLENSARVAATGAGIGLATDSPAPADVRAAVEQIFSTPSYVENANRLAAEYAKHDALAAIADTINHLATTPAP
jgi:UDP:flavonoid glycosyltransferase YjiC (YdhE family)